jgi:hypothetical protein
MLPQPGAFFYGYPSSKLGWCRFSNICPYIAFHNDSAKPAGMAMVIEELSGSYRGVIVELLPPYSYLNPTLNLSDTSPG